MTVHPVDTYPKPFSLCISVPYYISQVYVLSGITPRNARLIGGRRTQGFPIVEQKRSVPLGS